MDRFQLLLLALSIVLILAVLRSLRQERMRVEHSVSWLVGGVLLMAAALLPGPLTEFAHWLGLESAPLAVFILALAVFVGIFYRQSRAISSLKDMNITLTQRLAMVEFELRLRDEERR
jgi:hypothetical protein